MLLCWLEINVNSKKKKILIFFFSLADLKHLRSVSTEEAIAFSQKNSLHFMETSALDGSMVETAFQNVLEDIYQVCNNMNVQNGNSSGNQSTQIVSQPGGNTIVIPTNTDDKTEEQGKCC